MKSSNDTIGNQSRDLPVCSAVPQPLRAPFLQTIAPLIKKVKVPRNRLDSPEGGGGVRGTDLHALEFGTRMWSAPRPGRFTPGKDPVLIVQEAGRTPGPVWRERIISPLPGFDPRTVQPVASLYSD
jgi:hypothetical protein